MSQLSLSLQCSSDIVRNGLDRDDLEKWIGNTGDYIEYKSDTAFEMRGIRVVFDSDLNRSYQNMPCVIKLKENRFKLPETLIKDFDIVVITQNGATETYHYKNSHDRLVRLSISGRYKCVRLVPLTTYGAETFNVFSFEVF